MRRGLAGLILGLSLAVASLAWAGFVMTHTVLDPSRSERLADQVLDNETLRAALVSRLTDSLAAALPEGTPIPRQQLEDIADTALDDPTVESMVRDGIVASHQNALNGVDDPVILNATALTDAARAALVSKRPDLDAVVPEGPTLAIEMPSTGLSWLGGVRTFVVRFTWGAALVAIVGALSSLIVAKNRAAVLRRVSAWAFGAAAFWLAVGYLIPYLANRVGPTSSAVATAFIDVLFGAMIQPAIVMAAFGVLLLGFSFAIAAVQDRRPARMLQPSPSRAAAPPEQRKAPRAGQQSNVRRSPSAQPAQPAQQQGSPRPGSDHTAVQPRPTGQQGPATPTAYPGSAARQAPAATPQQSPQPQQSSQPPQTPPTTPQQSRWVEGVGYVDESEG